MGVTPTLIGRQFGCGAVWGVLTGAGMASSTWWVSCKSSWVEVGSCGETSSIALAFFVGFLAFLLYNYKRGRLETRGMVVIYHLYHF